jgi:hypothetical protein
MSEIRNCPLIRQLAAPGALPRLTSQVRRKPELLETLLGALSSDTARVRFGAAKALRILSERAPDLIYPHFDFFVSFLHHDNSILRWNAMLLLGNLASVDAERRVDRIIDDYLAPIYGPHLIDAANTMRGAAAIAAAKPYLVDTIARRILKVEHATYATRECRNVAIGHAINSLGRLFPVLADKSGIQLFVSRQLGNARAATRKKAQSFLRKWPDGTARGVAAGRLLS